MEEKKIQNLKKKLIILLVVFMIFVTLFILIITGNIEKFDNTCYNLVIQFKSNTLTQVMKIITNIGGIIGVLSILITLSIILVIKKKEKYAIIILLNTVICAILNFLMMIVIQRQRPTGFRIIEEIGYSFPSGHSSSNMAFYGLLIYYIYKSVKNKKARNLVCGLLGVLIFLIGISRIYLGVHYTSDVIAGFLFGLSICIISSIISTKYI